MNKRFRYHKFSTTVPEKLLFVSGMEVRGNTTIPYILCVDEGFYRSGNSHVNLQERRGKSVVRIARKNTGIGAEKIRKDINAQSAQNFRGGHKITIC